MLYPKDSDEARQLAEWKPLIDQAVKRVQSRPRLKWSMGDSDDARQIGMIALLEAMRSPMFSEVRNKGAYLFKCIRHALADAASESSLIHLGLQQATELIASEGVSGVEGKGSDSVRRAMKIRQMENMDRLQLPSSTLDSAELSERAMLTRDDVAKAMLQLPPKMRQIVGCLYGVAGYSKLDVQEIAARRGIAVASVRRKACDGRRLLRAILKNSGYGTDTAAEVDSDGTVQSNRG